MEFTKTNFVEKAACELGIGVGEYLKNADFNYVIFYKGKVDAWKDGSPVIYGDEMSVIAEIEQSNGLDENGIPTSDWSVMTEWDFICNYCLDWLVAYLANYICNDDSNDYDGICWIHWLDKGFWGAINIDDGKYTDILGAYVDEDGALSFSVCDGGFMFDNVTFVGLSEFDNNVIYKITMSVLCGLEGSQCAIE